MQIKRWQIVNGELGLVDTDAARTRSPVACLMTGGVERARKITRSVRLRRVYCCLLNNSVGLLDVRNAHRTAEE